MGMGPIRLRAAVALLVTIILGVISRTVVTGFVLFDKYLGDVLYTAAIFWLIWLIWPKYSARRVALLSFGLSLVIEIFQLTGIPLAMRESSSVFLRIVSIALGSEFSLWDVLAYGVGALICAGIRQFNTRSLDYPWT